MITRFVLIVLLLGTVGCSVTIIQAMATDNPLDRIEQQAQEDWSIERVDANTLYLSNPLVYYSIVNFGYVVSHANLVYNHADSMLYIQYSWMIFSLFYLFIPTTHDLDYRRSKYQWSKWSQSARMDEEIDDIMRWSGSSVAWKRRSRLSDVFPPPKPIPLPP